MYEFKMKFCEMVRGASAYEVAARNGFEGTEAEWVAALEGGAKDAQTAAQQAAAEAQAAAGRAGKAADSAGENADAAAASAEAAALSAAKARSHAVTAETRAADAQQARADAIAAAGDAATAKQAAQSAAAEAAEAGTKATQAAQSAAAEANRAFQIEQSIKQYESSAAASKTAAARSAADAARSAKAAKQSDWNAAEGEAGHILNRPFYTEGGGGGEVLLPECSPEYSDDMGGFLIYNSPLLESGKTYTVNYNGAAYACIGVDGAALGEPGAVILGDVYTLSGGNAGTEATGEPFVILNDMVENDDDPPFPAMVIVPIDGATELTISITSGNGETIHKLDNKYLDLDWLPTEERIQRIAKQTIACAYPASGGYAGSIRVPAIADGEKLIVVVDGVEFRCTAEITPYMTQYYWIKIGNRALLDEGEDTGEPFYISGNSLDGYGFAYITAGAHTVEAYRSEPNKMPVEFLPDGVGSTFVVNVEMTADLSSGTADKTSTEIHQALVNGRNVLAYCGGYIAHCIGCEEGRGAYFMVPMGSHSSNILTSFSALVLFCVNNDGSVVTGAIPTP